MANIVCLCHMKLVLSVLYNLRKVSLMSTALNLSMKSLFLSGSTGESLEVWRELDLQRVEQDLRRVQSKGIRSLAVLLLHSYTFV